MRINTSGFDELQEHLKNIERNARRLDGENTASLDELFGPVFMREYTDFESFDEMLEESRWNVETVEDFKSIPDRDYCFHLF